MTENKQQETLSLGTIFLCLFGIPILYYLVYPIAVKTFYKYTAPGPDEIVQIYLCTKSTTEIKYSNPGKSTAFNLADNCAEAIQFDVPGNHVSQHSMTVNKVVGSVYLNGYFGDGNSLPVTDKRRLAYHPDWENIRVGNSGHILGDRMMTWRERVPLSTETRSVEESNYDGFLMRKVVSSHIYKNKEGKKKLFKRYFMITPAGVEKYFFEIGGGGCQLPKKEWSTTRCKVRDQYQREYPYLELQWSLNPEYLEIWPEKRRRIVKFFEPLYRDESGQIKYVDVQALRESGVIRN